jgi:hypothetical protein
MDEEDMASGYMEFILCHTLTGTVFALQCT